MIRIAKFFIKISYVFARGMDEGICRWIPSSCSFRSPRMSCFRALCRQPMRGLPAFASWTKRVRLAARAGQSLYPGIALRAPRLSVLYFLGFYPFCLLENIFLRFVRTRLFCPRQHTTSVTCLTRGKPCGAKHPCNAFLQWYASAVKKRKCAAGRGDDAGSFAPYDPIENAPHCYAIRRNF